MVTTTPTVVRRRLCHLKTSPENDKLYSPVDEADPEIIKLAESIREYGVLEPLVITQDKYIISGHRRFVAAKLIGQQTVPCRVVSLNRQNNHDAFIKLLREHNRQRTKTRSEGAREAVVSASPAKPYQSLIGQRSKTARIDFSVGKKTLITGEKKRYEISPAKSQMMRAIRKVILVEQRNYRPISVRKVHYCLLNHQPLRHTNKPGSRYINDRKSYQDCSDLLTRARLSGEIPWEAISDETRPITSWKCWADTKGFTENQVDRFFTGYWRNLLQSQPNHIEVLCEKNTVFSVVKQITERYCITTSSGRGFSSITPWHDLAERFKLSGKQRLILIVLSDFDPEGEEIVQVAGRTLGGDFGIRRRDVIKVAVTPDQIDRFELPPDNEANVNSSRYKKFVDKHGHNVFELEALPNEVIQDELTAVIDSVIDTKAFNAELAAEKRDAGFLEAKRKKAIKALLEALRD